jgi:dipeptidase E
VQPRATIRPRTPHRTFGNEHQRRVAGHGLLPADQECRAGDVRAETHVHSAAVAFNPMNAQASTDTEIKIAFGGGGEADDEHAVLEVFASWVNDGRVLYVPVALDPPHEPYLDWAVTALGSVGISDIAMASSGQQLVDGLTRADAVFIGGGNVYSLRHALRATTADRSLKHFAEGGRPVYGGSAGAIVLGRDIDTGRLADPNDVGLVNTMGLDLAFGYAVWCHYISDDDLVIHDYVNETGIAVLAIPECGGLARTGHEIRVLGPEPSRIVHSQTTSLLQPGTVISPGT